MSAPSSPDGVDAASRLLSLFNVKGDKDADSDQGASEAGSEGDHGQGQGTETAPLKKGDSDGQMIPPEAQPEEK
jgi:hypothetical protein